MTPELWSCRIDFGQDVAGRIIRTQNRTDECPMGAFMIHVSNTEPLLTPAEVATMFRVNPKTVTRWAEAGKLTSIRTLGGHRRFREKEVLDLLAGLPQVRPGD